jgi:hypothetical protein
LVFGEGSWIAGQELRAMAVASASAGVSQAFPIGAAGSPDRRDESTGARSQLGALMAALTVVGILLFLTGPLAHLPKAVLGAVIVSAAIGLVNIRAWRTLAATGGGSGNPFTVLDRYLQRFGACSISGTKVSFTGVGSCVIDTKQTGNGNYLAAPQAQQALTIAKAILTVSADNKSEQYGAPIPPLTAAIRRSAGSCTGKQTLANSGVTGSPTWVRV